MNAASKPLRRVDFLPWEFDPTSDEGLVQDARRSALTASGAVLGSDVFVALDAAVFCDALDIGDRTYIAGLAYLSGSIALGDDCSVNPFAVVRGDVTVGNGVRIGAHTSILGFDHGMEPGAPVFRQAVTSRGITIGDDVWIGSNAVILDGVTIGSHAVVGAGSVVTKPVAPWAVVAGNPAKTLRDRRTPRPRRRSSEGAVDLARFGGRARDQAPAVLARAFDGVAFRDRPGASPATVRPWADAVEIADLLLGDVPPGFDRAELIRLFQDAQDPSTGLVGQHALALGRAPEIRDVDPLSPVSGASSYHVLSVGYALELLGAGFTHPIGAVADLDQTTLRSLLGELDWGVGAWAAGAAVDALGTAVAHNVRHFSDQLDDGGVGPLHTLLGWLTANADPESGLWGAPLPGERWLQSVNGFYRLTRGTYAQFGLPLPYPEASVRTVLKHARSPLFDSADGYTACNVLDVIHPLWLARKQTDVGRAEAETWARGRLEEVVGLWQDGAGFAFAPRSTGNDGVPGLQGTEMWLAITWLLADYLDEAEALPFRPRGVHRPDPLVSLPTASSSLRR